VCGVYQRPDTPDTPISVLIRVHSLTLALIHKLAPCWPDMELKGIAFVSTPLYAEYLGVHTKDTFVCRG